MDHEETPKRPKRRRSSEPGVAPTRASLHEAALSYLARSAATADSVTKTLQRRIASWARRATRAGKDVEVVAADVARAKDEIAPIVARLKEVGLVDDVAFAETRARRLARAGRSRRAISAHLAGKGVASQIVREAVPHDAAVELDAAIAFARRKRIGPFAREAPDESAKKKALGAMARAGFDWSVCERVLRMDREAADERLKSRHGFE